MGYLGAMTSLRLPIALLLLTGGFACSDSTVGTNNSAPEASIEQPSADASFELGDTVLFVGSVRDSGTPLGELLVTWSSSIDGPLADGLAETDGSTSHVEDGLSAGAHTITLLVRDAQGASDTASTTLTVASPNSAPSCGITAPASNATFATGELVLLEGFVDDADEPADQLTVLFSSNVDGALGGAAPSTGGDVALGLTTLSADTHTVTLAVTDAAGGDLLRLRGADGGSEGERGAICAGGVYHSQPRGHRRRADRGARQPLGGSRRRPGLDHLHLRLEREWRGAGSVHPTG